MYELIKKDLIYKIAAILLAILLWFYVTNLKNPIIEKTISVPISYIGLREGFVIEEKPDNIDVVVRGLNSVIEPLSQKDIKASVDLQNVKIGESTYPVNLVSPTGVEIINQDKKTVKLVVDAVLMRQFTLQAQTINTVASGYSSYEPVITPSRVVVRGAQRLLDNVMTAQVTIDLNQSKDNLNLNLPVNLLDKDGLPVSTSSLEINPQTVQVFVPVIQNIPTKTVPIQPVLIGQPKEQWRVSRVILEPETVKISGPYERLVKIDHVVTQPIDTTDLQEDLVTQVALMPPEGVSLLYDPAVRVIVQLEEAPVSQSFEGIDIQAVNTPEGYKVQLKPSTINITVRGPREEMSGIKNRIKAIVDLAEIQQGTHQLEVKIEVPNGFSVTKVEPSKVEATVSKL